MAPAEFALGMVGTAVHGYACDSCKRKIQFFTKRQRAQWAAKRSDASVRIECRGWLPFRRMCRGQLVSAEAVSVQ